MNLLPFKQKKRIKLEIAYHNVIFSGLISIILILFLIFALGVLLIFLNFKYQIIEEKITSEQSRLIEAETIKGMERKVGELNKELLQLKQAQSKTKSFYEMIENITNDILVGVEVHNIEIDGSLNKFTISGYSATRERLLIIKEKLENSQNYKDVNFPVFNFTNQKDINFIFSFTYYGD